jgi:hypothetical protein
MIDYSKYIPKESFITEIIDRLKDHKSCFISDSIFTDISCNQDIRAYGYNGYIYIKLCSPILTEDRLDKLIKALSLVLPDYSNVLSNIDIIRDIVAYIMHTSDIHISKVLCDTIPRIVHFERYSLLLEGLYVRDGYAYITWQLRAL